MRIPIPKEDRPAWHRLTEQEAAAWLAVDPQAGLTSKDAGERLQQAGPNVLIEQRRRGIGRILWDQLRGALILLLVVASVVSAALGDIEDAAAILAIVILNAALGVRQEYKAEEAMAALKQLSEPVVKLRRDGKLSEVPTRDLVPGDIVLLEAGAVISADVRLLETAALRTDEAALTGESEPVEKDSGAVCDEPAALGDRRNMVYRGTTIVYGRGVGLVVETGMRTELGKIADLIQTVRSEPTPLQDRLDKLGKTLVFAALAVVVVVFAAGLLQGQPLDLMFLTAVSLAVAAAPEGLPAVATIALALGARRMLARNALIRRLPAVETLGSVTCICSDKTGTLTQNRMRVAAIVPAGEDLSPEPGGSEPPISRFILCVGALCNDAEWSEEGQQAVGEPTERALVVAAYESGLNKSALEKNLPRIAEAPFDSERKRMSTLHRVASGATDVLGPLQAAHSGEIGFVVFAKGALDAILDISDTALRAGRLQPLGSQERQEIDQIHDRIAGQGMRVLAMAAKGLAESPAEAIAENLEQGLTFLGLVALIDPPRVEAKASVAACRRAGIRTVMITGDHPATARYIADELGIGKGADLLRGADLDMLDDGQLKEKVERVGVYARVSPQHKLRIVEALQSRGQIVAMTGDGVNDAPALKRADIGVAMGLTGSDVSREAADMVLRDDNFATIVSAVEEGRVIFDNIRKFVKFLLSANSGELWVMLCGPLFGLPLPLLPLQILWMNLITDGLPALALGVEPAEKDVMDRPPYGAEESVFSRGVGRDILWIGLLMGGSSLAVGWFYWSAGETNWQTMLFTTMTLSQLSLALAVRSESKSLFAIGLLSNPYLAAAIGVSVLLQMAVVYTAPLQAIFDTVPLTARDLATCLAASTATFWALEAEKILLHSRQKRKAPSSGGASSGSGANRISGA
jgi:Ca2+-transporting ATPase